MKQVTQTPRTGVVEVRDVPVPALQDSFVLVRNAASLISAGTERTTIQTGKKSLLQKARARPDLVKQVIGKIQREGLLKTVGVVQERLNSPSALGYSSAGSVIAVGGRVEGVMPGDRVACGGAGFANHAEIVAVPKNLVVPVPDGVSDHEAAFTTVGAIALQGVRLAEPALGETFLVIGLGLVGQIAVQLLRANGCAVIGTDPDASMVAGAEAFGATGIAPGDDVLAACLLMTQGHGVDGVLVCAGTTSNQPIELCGQVTRQQGRVVVVGAVGMDIPRDEFFRKEISIVISRSYGPGRYDPKYEIDGHDYPIGYVRFTEQRNMQTFLDLVAAKSVRVEPLISHRFAIEDAVAAYDLIDGEARQPHLGVILEYAAPPAETHPAMGSPSPRLVGIPSGLTLSFYGAGNYATASLLPILKDIDHVNLGGLVTASGRSAENVAKRFDFSFCAGEFDELLGEGTDAVVVATRHDTHAQAAVEALRHGKHVYVEKPLALTIEEIAAVASAYRAGDSQVMVGFNRRFAPATHLVIDHFAKTSGPLVVNIRVNAGEIPFDHWIQDPRVGGGRIIGECCHFVDLAAAIIGSKPKSVFATAASMADRSAVANDNMAITLAFEDGSIASIVYTSVGASSLPKEYVEVFGGGLSASLHDFGMVRLYDGAGATTRRRFSSQDKGQKKMLESWVDGLRSGAPCIDFETLMAVSVATVRAVESMMVNAPLDVDLAMLDVE